MCNHVSAQDLMLTAISEGVSSSMQLSLATLPVALLLLAAVLRNGDQHYFFVLTLLQPALLSAQWHFGVAKFCISREISAHRYTSV